ncbi:acyl-CoA thioesterase domain-containing protein [Bradyrhizobium australiense]|uniref:Thioesterase family protein n=1 Tax=Bradyrhizobium australiense TaxID=2721161 RepID=A0A7Y4GNL2_9BRAD|nr:acyl-CoA thioesterase domain-containing protein [Bradyrhizobium australiense]NOJ39100.1 thioesterase family protein [Bradyrhizobium australiense]
MASGQYRATPEVSGPFRTVQEGVLAGLAAVEIDGHARPGFQVLSSRTEFLRPVPLGKPLDVTVDKVQQECRTATLGAVILGSGEGCVRSTITLSCPVHREAFEKLSPFSAVTPPKLCRRVNGRSPYAALGCLIARHSERRKFLMLSMGEWNRKIQKDH